MPMLWKWFKRLFKATIIIDSKNNMSDLNINTRSVISYYCNLKVPPEYALLIKGPWGSGKSHLVKNTIEELELENPNFKFLFVSLYGISDISDVEAKFFEQLNPVLSNKKIMFAGQIAKGVLKGALKIDLDGDGKTDASANVTVPDINLADYLTDTRNCILVFDDLERCKLDLQIILGYINYFIEKDGYKVLIIADEDKLITKYTSKKDSYNYLDIKEKLVGKTVQVEPDVSKVFSTFVNELFPSNSPKEIVGNSELKDILNDNQERIIEVFHQSEHNNLRSLRKCILDLKQWIEILDRSIKKNQEVLEKFISIFIAVSLEVYSGKLRPNDVEKLLGDKSYVLALGDEEFKKDFKFYKDLTGKYTIDFDKPLFDIVDWMSWFNSGFINKDNINNVLLSSDSLKNQNNPDWKKLLHLFDLEQHEFEKLKLSVWEEFENLRISDFGAIKHIVGIYIYLAEQQLIDKNSEQVVKQAKQIVEIALSKNTINITDTLNPEADYGSYAGVAYFSNETKEFNEFNEHFCNKIYDYQADLRKKEVPNLLELLKHNLEEFNSLLCDQSGEVKSFAHKSILNNIPINEFVDALNALSNTNKKTVCQTLRMRYRNQGGSGMSSELQWRDKLIVAIINKYNGKTDLDSLVMKKFAEWLKQD